MFSVGFWFWFIPFLFKCLYFKISKLLVLYMWSFDCLLNIVLCKYLVFLYSGNESVIECIPRTLLSLWLCKLVIRHTDSEYGFGILIIADILKAARKSQSKRIQAIYAIFEYMYHVSNRTLNWIVTHHHQLPFIYIYNVY